MSDYIVRATAANSQVRAFAAVTTETVETARKAHNTSPVATAALGRLLTAGAMMGVMMKGDKDILTLQIQASGPLEGITVTADSQGRVKGYVGNPEVIILDEPTVGLDPKQIIEIRDLIKSLGQKHTVILSSHILSEVSAVCDHVLIIDKGKLVASDTPKNLGKLMSGANSLELTVKGQESEIRKALDMVENIEDVIYHDSLIKNACDFTIKLSGNQDMRENIFFALAEVKCPILKMQSSNMSLEEVFLKLTDDAEKERKVEIESGIFEVDENMEPEYEEGEE